MQSKFWTGSKNLGWHETFWDLNKDKAVRADKNWHIFTKSLLKYFFQKIQKYSSDDESEKKERFPLDI